MTIAVIDGDWADQPEADTDLSRGDFCEIMRFVRRFARPDDDARARWRPTDVYALRV